jgi:splicing factor 3B subunit 3
MELLNLTLQPPTSITCSIVGSFSGTPRQQEICVCRGGTRLEILKLDATTQKLEIVFGSDAFGSVRCMVPFRLTGQGKGERMFRNYKTVEKALPII